MLDPRWIPFPLTELLVAEGHSEAVRREALDGDWGCARALGKDLVARGGFAAALDLYRPFLTDGTAPPDPHRPLPADGVPGEAAKLSVDALVAGGDVEAAIATARRHADTGDRNAAESVLQPGRSDHLHGELLAEVLIRQGRVDEAITVLHAREPLVWGAAAGE
ncbi:hypothetical protein [Dactylosporangium sp. NPDC006015]|uniref:hypothetical protein n=1 Tax=Dactylosporangium sp. NPDC006015 TaxID=3154576 RepID=UPI0033B3EDEB